MIDHISPSTTTVRLTDFFHPLKSHGEVRKKESSEIRNQQIKKQTPQPKRLSPPFLPRCVFPSSLKTSFALLGARFDSVYDISLLGTGRKTEGNSAPYSAISYLEIKVQSLFFLLPVNYCHPKTFEGYPVWLSEAFFSQ